MLSIRPRSGRWAFKIPGYRPTQFDLRDDYSRGNKFARSSWARVEEMDTARSWCILQSEARQDLWEWSNRVLLISKWMRRTCSEVWMWWSPWMCWNDLGARAIVTTNKMAVAASNKATGESKVVGHEDGSESLRLKKYKLFPMRSHLSGPRSMSSSYSTVKKCTEYSGLKRCGEHQTQTC